MRIRPFKALYPKLGMIPSVETFIGTVKEDFIAFRDAQFFTVLDKPAYYIYHITKADAVFRGLIAANAIEDLTDHKIRKHEKTLAPKEQHMLRLTLERRAQIKPVLLAYDGGATLKLLDAMIMDKSPMIDITLSDEQHTIWPVQHPSEVQAITQAFGQIPKAYIADGHHRCATTNHLHSGPDSPLSPQSLLVLYMPFADLKIYEYNRVVRLGSAVTTVELMARLSTTCKIKPLTQRAKPKAKHQMTCCLEGKWYLLTWRKKVLNTITEDILFDADLLNEHVLIPACKIKDVRNDPRLTYVPGSDSLKSLEQLTLQNPDTAVFVLFPISKRDFKHVAGSEDILPPKSTWFEPRIKNGLINLPL